MNDKLTAKEEEIMHVLWEIESGFVKELIERLPAPKPHYNTVSTIIRILEDKGFVQHKAFGKSHQYFPVVSKTDYKRSFLKGFVQQYFSNSYKDVVSFFAQEDQLDENDLRDILKLIHQKSNKSK